MVDAVRREIGHRSGPTPCAGSVLRMSDRLGSDRTNALLLVAAMIALMWILEVVDVVADHRLDNYGIHPRDVDGLPEILAAPFLHVGFGHLISNTIPFAAMGAAIALGGLA